MPTIDVPGFAAEVEALALRFEASDLPGLLSKKLTVPKGAVALIVDDHGAERVIEAGATETGAFRAVLAKTHDQAVSFQMNGLRTSQGRVAEGGVELVVRVPPRLIDLKALGQTLLAKTHRLDLEALRTYLTPFVQTGLARFCAGHSAEELMTEDPRDELDGVLREDLKAGLFSAGLDLIEVRHPSFYCEEFEDLRRARLEAAREEEELQRAEQLQDMKARLERNEHIKRQEVEEFAKVLQYKGILKELSLKQDLDRRRKEEKLRRYEAIHKQVGNDDLKAMIFLLEDDRLKAQLLEQLIERDMTEDQLRAKKAADLEKRFEDRLAAFAKEMDTLNGQRKRRVVEGGTRTRRVLVVHGKQALAFDPTTNVRRESPKEVYDARDGGSATSARCGSPPRAAVRRC